MFFLAHTYIYMCLSFVDSIDRILRNVSQLLANVFCELLSRLCNIWMLPVETYLHSIVKNIDGHLARQGIPSWWWQLSSLYYCYCTVKPRVVFVFCFFRFVFTNISKGMCEWKRQIICMEEVMPRDGILYHEYSWMVQGPEIYIGIFITFSSHQVSIILWTSKSNLRR